jgi:hypothetical protein
MSASTSLAVSCLPVPAERRVKYRYALDLRVRFRSASAESSFSGAGQVLNMSSGGILVASKYQITVGALVEMRIEWPSLLNGKVSLQLFAVGRILRREKSGFAATFERHQFRTMKRSSQPEARLGGDVIQWPPSEPECAAGGLLNLNLE